MRNVLLYFLLVFFSLRSTAAETAPEPKEAAKELPTFLDQISLSRETRERKKYFVFASYSPFDLLIPSKIGITGGYHKTGDKSWEFEYLKGSVSVPFVVEDLGRMTDEKFSILCRSYFGGNSFNLSYGLTYFNFSLHLGDRLINRVTAGAYPSLDVVELKSIGGHVGLGNRWVLNNGFSFGIDWISWSQPIFVTEKNSAFLTYATNQEDRDDVGKALNVISYFPRFAVVKLQIGYVF